MTRLMKNDTAGYKVWATWSVKRLPNDLTDFYIQATLSDTETGGDEWHDDINSFHITDKGAVMTIESDENGYRVKLVCPATPDVVEIDDESELLLSPAFIEEEDGGDGFEADFGQGVK